MERITFKEIPQGLFGKMMRVEEYLNNSGLDSKLLELARYRVSQINGCAYCIDMHHIEALNEGETELRLHSLSAWRDSPFYSDKEKAVLAYAEAVTKISEDEINDSVYQPLLKFFSKQEIANLTLAVAQINSWTRLAKSLKFAPGNYKK